MKILYIEHAAVYPEELKKYDHLATRAGVEIKLVKPLNWNDPFRSESGEERERDYEIISAPVIFPGYRHRSFFIRKAAAIFKRFKPDIIHVFDEANTLFAFQALMLKSWYCPGAKLVFDNFQNILYERVPYRFFFLYDYVEKRLFNRADGATVRYSGSLEFLRHRGYKGAVRIIPWGTDTEWFCPRQKKQEKAFNIGYVGRIAEEKGIFLLLRALSLLPEPARLTIVGKGKRDSMQQMFSLIDSLGMACRVDYRGYVDQADLPATYGEMDCVVVPTLTTRTCKEQFGRVVVEAMACGVPVIGSESGAIPHLIADSGLICKENNVGDLADKIRILAENPQQRQKLGAKARQRVENRYSWSRFGRECHRFYEEILAKDWI